MEKIGDNNARVKDEAEKIIYSMVDCPSVGITPIINQLIRVNFNYIEGYHYQT